VVLALRVLRDRLEPRLTARAKHCPDLIGEFAPHEYRIARHQVIGKLVSDLAPQAEVRPLRVEVLREFLMQRIQRALLLEEALAEFVEGFGIHRSQPHT